MVTLLAGLALIAAKAVAVRWKGAEGWSSYRPSPDLQSPMDRLHTERFLGSGTDEQRYDDLFRFFVIGAAAHADGASIHYTGYPSKEGYRVSGVEGFARIAPLLGAWIYSRRPAHIALSSHQGDNIDLVRFLRSSVLAGTHRS